MVSVLGISPGTRTIGLAVFSDKVLIRWQVKTFKGAWSERKLQSILIALLRILDRYAICSVVCKVIHPSHESEQGRELVEAIARVCHEKRVRFVPCSLEDILSVILYSGSRVTKEVLADFLVLRYPELSREFTKEGLNHNPYYIKLFEAIAAVEFYRRME